MKPDGRLFGDPRARFWSRSLFSVSARTAMHAISALASLRDCDRHLRAIMVSACCKGPLSFRLQEKEKARSDERA